MSNIKLFDDKQVRTTWSQAEEKWFFVVELAKGWVQFVHTLTVKTIGGKQRMNCAGLKGIFRIIQSIPSPKAAYCGLVA